jgi:serpin B
MKTRTIVLVLALAVVAASCVSDDGDPTTTSTSPFTTPPEDSVPPPATFDPNVSFIQADVGRSAATDVAEDEVAALVAGNRRFAFDLYRAAGPEGNFIVSPYSIATALTMTLAGARGTTAEQMTAALNLQALEDRIHAARNELDLRVTAEAAPEFEGDEREPFAIRTANSLWGQPGYPFLDAFLELLARDYGAGMHLADFVADPEAARVQINEWVEDKTEGRIVDLIAPGLLDPMTRLVLVNAIWFKANWAEQFSEDLTEDAPFNPLDGAQVDVPMMLSTDRTLLYARGDDHQAVRLPYTGDASMLLVLPDTGAFTDVLAALDADAFASVEASLQPTPLTVGLPRFEFRTELGLNDVLRALGIEAALVAPPGPGSADFTGMTEIPELYVSDVVHQAFITVDEEGTEAAAATAVIMRATSALPEEPTEVIFDRPFLFFIQHDSTGEILFMGQVTNPAAD